MSTGEPRMAQTEGPGAIARAPPAEAAAPSIGELWAAARGHHKAGRLVEAARLCRRILAVDPSHIGSLHHLGIIAHQIGRSDLAVELIGKVIDLDDQLPEPHFDIGTVLHGMGRLDEAVSHYRRAAALKPDHAEAQMNLGVVLRRQGKLDAAIAAYRQALTARSDYSEALHNLGAAYLTRGDAPRALEVIRRALAIRETPELKGMFIRCVSHPISAADLSASDVDALRGLVARAISEPWDRPRRLANVGANLVKHDPRFAASIRRAADAWPTRPPLPDLFGPSGPAAVFADPLLRALMESTQVCDIELERFLTGLRLAMLDCASEAGTVVEEDVLRFCCRLARQCWINEYVFDLADGERDRAAALRDSLVAAIGSGAPVSALRLALVASYFPLHTLTAPEKLMERPWPDAVAGLLVEQVREPLEEHQCSQAMPRLTAIDDDVSRQVQQQYEENPYPRWVKMEPARAAKTPEAWLRETFPSAALGNFAGRSSIDILVAGCGTGQHAIEAARRIGQARVLAVDLSLASLGYAGRKTRELGLDNIDHAQADILKLGSIGRSFDIVEASGVLHHLGDWKAGWRVLLGLLRPGGLMRLGVYSERARQDVVAARAFIAARGYAPTTDDIRRCRQDLLAPGTASGSQLARFQDFFTISECRDLLFHVSEQRLTLPLIKEFLIAHDLRFLGFEIARAVMAKYRTRFPEDESATDLDRWDVLETEHPGTFGSMYLFWVQKGV